MEVTASFFGLLGTTAVRGRVFAPDEAREGNNRFAILSFGFWQRAFAASDGIVGRDVRLNGERYVVVGVLPEGFTFLNPDVAIWTPLAFTAQQRSEDARYSQNHDQIARLAPGEPVQPSA
jgi:putative ABC transport system permease protein